VGKPPVYRYWHKSGWEQRAAAVVAAMSGATFPQPVPLLHASGCAGQRHGPTGRWQYCWPSSWPGSRGRMVPGAPGPRPINNHPYGRFRRVSDGYGDRGFQPVEVGFPSDQGMLGDLRVGCARRA
jgi:hypothetical protein